MSIRIKLLALVTSTFITLLLIGSYWLNAYRNHLNNEQAISTATNLAVEKSHRAETLFHLQLSTWKNLLLRGSSLDNYHTYLQQYYQRERDTRESISELCNQVANLQQISEQCETLTSSHLALGRTFREALRLYNATTINPGTITDQFVSGVEEKTANVLTALAGQLQQNRQHEIAELQGLHHTKENYLLSLFVATMLISFSAFLWLTDKNIARPAEQATRLSTTIKLAEQAVNLGIWEWDLKNNTHYWSESLYALLGISKQQTPSLQLFSGRLSPEDQSRVRGDFDQAINAGSKFELEVGVSQPDIQNRMLLVRGKVEQTGNDHRMIILVADITELAQARQQLASSEMRYRGLFESAGDAIVLLHDGHFIDCNTAALATFGCTREQLLGKSPIEFSTALQYDGRSSAVAALEQIQNTLQHGTNPAFAWRHRKLDGTPFDAEVTLNRVEIDGVSSILGIVRDVTLRKRNEEAIKNIATGVSTKTGEDFFKQLVIQLGKLFGTKYAFIGLQDTDDPMLINTLAVSMDGAIADNISYRLEDTPCAIVIEQGTCTHQTGVQQKFPRDVLLQQMGVDSYIGTPLFDSHGKPLGLIVLLDVKPLQQTEWVTEILQIFSARASSELERVRAERELFIKERAMESATEGMMLTAYTEGNPIIYVNRALENLTGYTRAELIGVNISILQGPETDPATIARLNQAMTQQQSCHAEMLNYRKDGSSFWTELTITPVTSETGQVTHYIGTMMDVTARRQTEEGLRRAQKMEAIGQLAGGIAHDFNNQLGIVIGYLDFLDAYLAGQVKQHQWVATATQATLRCMDLTRQLLTFSRRKAKETSVTDINHELGKMDKLITRAITPAISVEVFPARDLWPVAIDPGELQDAILNLVINARDAMPNGGKLIIETTNKIVDKHYVEFNPALTPGDYVQIMVSDTGVGIDAATMERVFEPFFTTKSEGKGTGLGLAMVYGFTRRFGGDIKVYSEPGVGTTFRIYLPRDMTNSGIITAPQTAIVTNTGSGTILIVDDEKDLLQLAERYLQDMGYHTYISSNPHEALSLLQQHQDIDLLFSDVVMPGTMNGYALAEAAVKIRPGLKVLLTSGFTANTIAVNGQAKFSANLLHKPYRQHDLAVNVRKVLDQEASA